MKIVYLHQYFKTPQEGGAIRSYHIAKALVKAGHDVTMITSHNTLNREEKLIEDIKVIYLPVYYSNELSFISRIKAYLKFGKLARKEASKINDIDLVYATSTPLTIGLTAIKINKPFVFEVRDLWPKIPVELGYIHPIIGYFLYKLEKRIYKKAKTIFSLSPETKQYIDKLGFSTKNQLIPNMSDCLFFQSNEVNSDFKICYTGTFGKANHLEYLIDVAKECHKIKLPIQFILAGEGKEFYHIQFLARTLPNVIFKSYSNKKKMKSILDSSNASYISFLKHSALEGMSPNKFFDALAAGKLTIVNTKGWLKDYVENNHCGFYHNPSDVQEFITKITPYLTNKVLLQQTQKNARQCAVRDFSVHELTNKINTIISD